MSRFARTCDGTIGFDGDMLVGAAAPVPYGNSMIWPVILSGGSGTRLWPLSRAATPKQLLALTGPDTLLQSTVKRASDPMKFNPCIVVANAAHLATITAQLGAIAVDPAAIILEPAGRNTAPAIALAAEWLVRQDPQSLMLVMPSDHAIGDEPAFQAAIDAALPAATEGWLVTFGIKATRPETGYGYIKVGTAISAGLHRVEQFVEKPDATTAAQYLANGSYAWNGGIFLMRCDRYLAALQRHAPAIAAAVSRSMAGMEQVSAIIRPDPIAFGACPSDSIDYAVMERDDHVAVAPVSMGWSDIGSWDALLDIAGRDPDGNHLLGDVIAIGTTNSLVRSDGPLVTAVGLTGITIVATDDAVLVAASGQSQQVKAVVDQLAAAGRREHLDAVRLVHPWGVEHILTRSSVAIVSELGIEPGKSRPEDLMTDGATLTVMAGLADIIVGTNRTIQVAGSQLVVPIRSNCAISNPSDSPLRIAVVRIVR